MAGWRPPCECGHQETKRRLHRRDGSQVPAGGSHHGSVQTPQHCQASWSSDVSETSKWVVGFPSMTIKNIPYTGDDSDRAGSSWKP